jgi:transcriptional regulator with XRE-family HTH domain
VTFGERLRQERRARCWTQGYLAELTGSATRQISDYETGKHRPSLYLIFRMAAALDLAPSQLFEGVTEP